MVISIWLYVCHIDYVVGDYSYFVDDENVDDFFDEEDVLNDDDEFKPGFFDEEDDEFFKTLDEERKSQYDEYEKNTKGHVISNTKLPNQVIKIELNPDGSVKRISKQFKDWFLKKIKNKKQYGENCFL